MTEHIVAFGRTNTIAPAMVSPRRASSRKSSRILITPGSTRTEARIPSRLRLRNFALIAFRPCGETLTVAVEGLFDNCMASIPFVMSFGAGSAIWAAVKSSNGLPQSLERWRRIERSRGSQRGSQRGNCRGICRGRGANSLHRPKGDLRHRLPAFLGVKKRRISWRGSWYCTRTTSAGRRALCCRVAVRALQGRAKRGGADVRALA